MGMSIEEAIKEIESITVVTDEKQALAFALAVHTMKKYQMIQADYEKRLKADLVVMLTEIQLEIEELDSRAGYDGNGIPTFSTDYIRKKKVNDIIQQKINALKANAEDQDV